MPAIVRGDAMRGGYAFGVYGARRRAARDFVWAREHAIFFDSLDEARARPEMLRPLDPLVAGRRLAYLGECHHFVREKYFYRLLFVRWLHGHGFHHLGEELSWSDGLRVARYLQRGDPAEFDHVATYGYEGGKRTDRDDEPKGILAKIDAHQPVAALAAAQRRFAEALRPLRPLHFFGLDVDCEPGVGCELLDAWSRTLAASEPKLGRRLPRVAGESLDEEIARLRAAEDAIEKRGDALPRELRRLVRSVRQGLEYIGQAHPATSYDALRPAMAFRERVMVEQVEHVLAGAPQARVTLMAHNQHLSRASEAIRSPRASAGPGGDLEPALGTALARRRPGQVLSVWMLQDRGRDGRPLPGTSGEIASVAGSLNALLSEVGDAFALPLVETGRAARWLDEPAVVVSLYGHRLRLRIREQTDVVFFVREVSPLTA
jgi:erythromycin esterase-like protein